METIPLYAVWEYTVYDESLATVEDGDEIDIYEEIAISYFN